MNRNANDCVFCHFDWLYLWFALTNSLAKWNETQPPTNPHSHTRHKQEKEEENERKKKWKATHQKESFGEFYFISRLIVCRTKIDSVLLSALPPKQRKIKTKPTDPSKSLNVCITNHDWYAHTHKVNISQKYFLQSEYKKRTNRMKMISGCVFLELFLLFSGLKFQVSGVSRNRWKMNRCMSIECIAMRICIVRW